MISLNRDYGKYYSKFYLILPLIVFGLMLLRNSACSNATAVSPYLNVVDKNGSTTRELLNSDSDLSLFAKALKTADLMGMMDENLSLLVFAPTDPGLRDQGSAFLLEEELLAEDNEARLLFMLKSHIVENPALPFSIGNDRNARRTVKTLTGTTISERLIASEIVVGRDAFVTKMVKTSNGLVLYVDRLLWARFA